MKPVVLSWLLLLFTGGLMLAIPHISPRGLFFAVRTGTGFRDTETGRAALRLYNWSVAAALVAGAALIVAFGAERKPPVLLLAAMLPEVAGFAAFFRNYHRLRPHAAPPEGVREAHLLPAHDHLPWWTVFALPPFLLPAGVLIYLHVHFDEIPLRFPVHFGANGQPNRWVTRTTVAVDAPLLFAIGLMLLVLFVGVATFYGARRSPSRSTVLAVMLGVTYLLSLVFSGIGLSPLTRYPMWAAWASVGLTALFVVAVVAVSYWRSKDPTQLPDTTPDECWSMGDTYNNPNDPALFVPKRIGWGYTINIGNRGSWVVVGVFVGGLVGLIGFLVWALK